jgi:ABC-type transport system substrate-binding protein
MNTFLLLFLFSFLFTPVFSHSSLLYPSQDGYFDDYFIHNQGYVDEIFFKIIPSDNVMIQALLNGDIDIAGHFIDVFQLNTEDFTNPTFGIESTHRNGYGHLTFNTQLFPTNIRALRQGFSYALDKIELQQRALGGASFPVDSILVPALGIWACEYEYSDCEFPNGETYYEAQPRWGNQTVLSLGFYDVDNDGWREFFNGSIEGIWDGSVVAGGYFSYNDSFNGYSYNNKTFSEVAALGEQHLMYFDAGESLLKEEFKESVCSCWIDETDYEFEITGPGSGSLLIDVSIGMSIEAFQSLGIKASISSVTFSTMLINMEAGLLNTVFFAHSNDPPDPSHLDIFYSNNTENKDYHRWVNASFDELYKLINTSPDLDLVLQASYEAQRILWQEQPKVVLYNNERFSMYRKDQFSGFINMIGKGAFMPMSVKKIRLLEQFNTSVYPDYPLGGYLTYGLPQPMGSQNTLWDGNDYTWLVMSLIEEPLWTYNPYDLSPIGQLAYNWTINAPCISTDCIDAGIMNGTEITFQLLHNVTWHDGSPFTADDVIFTFNVLGNLNGSMYKDSRHSFPFSFNIDNRSEIIRDIRKINDYSVVMYLNITGYKAFEATYLPIYQKELWEQIPDPINYHNPSPIGTGPYRWKERFPGVNITLERYPDYYRQPGLYEPLPPISTDISTEIPTSISTEISSGITFPLTVSSSTTSSFSITSLPDSNPLRIIYPIFGILIIPISFLIGGLIAKVIRRE